MKSQQAALPDALSSHFAGRRFQQDLCAPPIVPVVPLAPTTPAAYPPAPASGGLDDVISQAEVEMALPKLANGRAAGSPVELLRYASYHIEDENGSMRKVWMLVPLLTSMLNAVFLGDSILACVRSGLVTPIHKKGCTLDSASYGYYRPIAVGEPLYKLYTTNLNARLVD